MYCDHVVRMICVVVAAQAVDNVAAAQSILPKQAPKDLIAAQIRGQGYVCERPISAKRDLARSKPDEAVWVLRCENNSYRIRLVPDMAAHVTRLK
jgi:hypothetical protein